MGMLRNTRSRAFVSIAVCRPISISNAQKWFQTFSSIINHWTRASSPDCFGDKSPRRCACVCVNGRTCTIGSWQCSCGDSVARTSTTASLSQRSFVNAVSHPEQSKAATYSQCSDAGVIDFPLLLSEIRGRKNRDHGWRRVRPLYYLWTTWRAPRLRLVWRSSPCLAACH